MKMYYVTDINNLLIILASQYISCNSSNDFLYKKCPLLVKNEVCIEVISNQPDNKNLLEYTKGIYYLTAGINLEIRNFNILFFNQEEVDNFKVIKDLYYEVKNAEFSCYVQNVGYNLRYEKVENVLKLPQISNYELYKSRINDALKGFLCGFLYNNNYSKKFVVNNYKLGYKELSAITKIISELRGQNLMDRTIYLKSDNFKKALEKKHHEQIKKLDKKELILYCDDKKQLRINRKINTLNEIELSLLEVFINNTIQNINLLGTKQLVRNNINAIHEYVMKNSIYNQYLEDIQKVYNRANDIDFEINIKDIKSEFFKNIFITYTKFENIKEFQLILDEKEVCDNYIAYSLFGLCKGYSKLPNSFVISNLYDSIMNNIFLGGIENIERIYGDRDYNRGYTENILYYYFNKIAFLLKNIETKFIENDQYIIILEQDGEKYHLIIENKEIGSLLINYYPRNLENTKYFDKKINKLRDTYTNFICNSQYYFLYDLRSGKIKKMCKTLQRYYYSIVIKDIYKIIESVVNNKNE